VAALAGQEAPIKEKERDMRVYILRHAEAEARSPGVAEATRQLTPQGRRELKTVLRRARAAGVAPEAILTSPWTRAVQTAQMAGETFNCERVEETQALLPDIPPAQVLREIRALSHCKEVLVAGHEPQLSRLAAFLLEAPLALDLKKSALLRIDVQEKQGPPRGVLKWMLTPKLAGGK
jgi:phosphohistidine phosphatase